MAEGTLVGRFRTALLRRVWSWGAPIAIGPARVTQPASGIDTASPARALETAGQINRRSFLVGLGAFVAASYVVDLKTDATIKFKIIRIARPSTFQDMMKIHGGVPFEKIVTFWEKRVPEKYEVPLQSARYNVRCVYS